MRERELEMKIINSISFLSNLSGFSHKYRMIKNSITPRAVILLYHHVFSTKEVWEDCGVSKEAFEKQLQWLSRSFQVVSLDELVTYIRNGMQTDRSLAVITFDDGYKDVFYNAYPLLKKFQIPATIFLTTQNIYTRDPFWWDLTRYMLLNTERERISLDMLGTISLNGTRERIFQSNEIVEKLKMLPENQKNYLIEQMCDTLDVTIPEGYGDCKILTWEEIGQMNDNGIDFGAHTFTHPILTKIPLKKAQNEIAQSKRDIETELDHPVNAFAYPNGKKADFNPKIINMLKDMNFHCALSTIPELISKDADLFRLSRIQAEENFDYFIFRASGLFSDIRRTLKKS